MTLFKGCHVVKLDNNGEPLMGPNREAYVEFEIVDLSPAFNDFVLDADDVDGTKGTQEVMQFVKLRKVR